MSGDAAVTGGLEASGRIGSLSELYQEKVQAGRAKSADAVSDQLTLLKAIRETVDAINGNDPFISIRILKASSSSGATGPVMFYVSEDGQEMARLRVQPGVAADGSGNAQVAFHVGDKAEPAFAVTETALATAGGVTHAFMQGLAEVLAAKALEKAPKNLPEAKIAAVFDLK